MIELYEVIYSEGENELKKYVVAQDEAAVVRHIRDLDSAAYFKLADNPEFTFQPGPKQLTKQDDGSWLETA